MLKCTGVLSLSSCPDRAHAWLKPAEDHSYHQQCHRMQRTLPFAWFFWVNILSMAMCQGHSWNVTLHSSKPNVKKLGHYLKEWMGLLIEKKGQIGFLWCSGIWEGPVLKDLHNTCPFTQQRRSPVWLGTTRYSSLMVFGNLQNGEKTAQKTDSLIMAVFHLSCIPVHSSCLPPLAHSEFFAHVFCNQVSSFSIVPEYIRKLLQRKPSLNVTILNILK